VNVYLTGTTREPVRRHEKLEHVLGLRSGWGRQLKSRSAVVSDALPIPLKDSCLISESKFIRPKQNSSWRQRRQWQQNKIIPTGATDWGAHSFLLLSGKRGSSFEIRGPGIKFPTPPSPEDKNEWSCTSTPYIPWWCGEGKLLVMKVCAKSRLFIWDNVHWYQSTFQQ